MAAVYQLYNQGCKQYESRCSGNMNAGIRFFYMGLLSSMVCALMVNASLGAHQNSDADVEIYHDLVVVVPSYNNISWYRENLDSLLMQKYPQEHVEIIYVNDCSPDGTGTLVDQYLQSIGLRSRVQLINNKERVGALANLYNAIHSCDDHKIILIVDGDDKLAHDQVFATINRAYQNPNIWMTYGQLKANVTDYGAGFCKPMPRQVIESNGYREYPGWIVSHLRTFRAALFKKIEKEDLMYENNFFSVAYDLAIMFPILEMAAGRWLFIEDVLYIYNERNPLNDFRVRATQQFIADKMIRARRKYQPLACLKC